MIPRNQESPPNFEIIDLIQEFRKRLIPLIQSLPFDDYCWDILSSFSSFSESYCPQSFKDPSGNLSQLSPIGGGVLPLQFLIIGNIPHRLRRWFVLSDYQEGVLDFMVHS